MSQSSKYNLKTRRVPSKTNKLEKIPHTTKQRHYWTPDEEHVLRELVDERAPMEEITETFPTVTKDALSKKIKRIKTEIAADQLAANNDQQVSQLLKTVLPTSRQVLSSQNEELSDTFESEGEETSFNEVFPTEIPCVYGFEMPDKRFYIAIRKFHGLHYQLCKDDDGHIVVTAKFSVQPQELTVISTRLNMHSSLIEYTFPEKVYQTILVPSSILHTEIKVHSLPEDLWIVASYATVLPTTETNLICNFPLL